MGELWRSEKMSLIQLFVQIDAAHSTIEELGKRGLVEFKDLNHDVNLFQRNFVNEVKQADDMEQTLKYFKGLIANENFEPERLIVPVEEDEDEDSITIVELEEKLEEYYQELRESVVNNDKLRRNLFQLQEFKEVLTKDTEFFASTKKRKEDIGGSSKLLEDDTFGSLEDEEGGIEMSTMGKGGGINFGYLTGLIANDQKDLFERILWRVTRGNLFMKTSRLNRPVDDPNSGNPINKSVFIIFYQGDKARQRIKKVCEALQANLYPCSKSSDERIRILAEVEEKIDDMDQVYQASNERQKRVLLDIARRLEKWRVKVVKEKAIYSILNNFLYDVGRRCLIGEGWCASGSLNEVREILKVANKKSGASMPTILNEVATNEIPPTFYKTNKFTRSFQDIVDAYGIARYQEVNPGVWTIITFPFLFAVMFGDAGHGLLMLLFALWMVLREKQWESWKVTGAVAMVFDGRYLILLMSLFSIYIGLIYNDCFSIPLPIFSTRWDYHDDYDHQSQQARWKNMDFAYPFGVDWAWKGTKNELIYYNSLKMKMSILLGVIHMMLGIVLKFFNGIHYKKPYDIWFEFIPQILFMSSIFGYMCVLIVMKWFTDWSGYESEAPGLLNMLIDMFLSPTNVKRALFDNQAVIQIILVIIALVSVPFMLFPKPLLLKRDWERNHPQPIGGFTDPLSERETRPKALESKKGHPHRVEKEGSGRNPEADRTEKGKKLKRKTSSDDDGKGVQGRRKNSSDEEEDNSNGSGSEEDIDAQLEQGHHGDHHDEDHFDFGEIFVHQVIHTIEFVLGAVSNTASYLRLWALSLAHAQLSSVFWVRIFVTGLKTNNALGVFVAWPIWAVITMGVLMGMESLSAFLHALRLHWVEFMNKFYYGDGAPFLPFSLDLIINPPRVE